LTPNILDRGPRTAQVVHVLEFTRDIELIFEGMGFRDESPQPHLDHLWGLRGVQVKIIHGIKKLIETVTVTVPDRLVLGSPIKNGTLGGVEKGTKGHARDPTSKVMIFEILWDRG